MPKSCHALPRAEALLISKSERAPYGKLLERIPPYPRILYSSTSLDCSLSPAQRTADAELLIRRCVLPRHLVTQTLI